MAGQRQLQPAAERRAVQRRDHRLVEGLDLVLQILQGGRRDRLAELLDVGAGDEGAAGADQDDGLDRRVRRGGLEPRRDAFAQDVRQRVDRRVVERQHCDLSLDVQRRGGIDCRHEPVLE